MVGQIQKGERMNRGMKLWGWPMVVGTVTGAGLVAALLGDGAWDYWSWLTLGGVSLLCAVVARKI